MWSLSPVLASRSDLNSLGSFSIIARIVMAKGWVKVVKETGIPWVNSACQRRRASQVDTKAKGQIDSIRG